MPVPDRSEDEADDYRDDFASSQPCKTRNPASIVGLVLGGALLLVLLVCGGFAALFVFRGADARRAEVAVQQAAATDQAVHRPDSALVPEPAKPDGAVTKPVAFTRHDFELKVIGKTRDQVTAAVGRPDEVRERVLEYPKVTPGGKDPGGRGPSYFDWWVYRDRVLNEVTSKTYPAVRVRFNDGGKADHIEYP